VANIHFIGGEKGGVGKSLVSRLLAQYLIDHETPFIGFDSDRSHGALMRFYSGYASPVLVDQFESLDAIVEAAVEQPERSVLVDLAAQTHAPLMKWLEDSDVLGLAQEAGFALRYWHVMDSGRDSAELLKSLFDQFEGALQYVIVLNEVRGDEFALFESMGLRARAEVLGATIVRIPRLPESAMLRIDATNASFWAAVNNTDKSVAGLGLLERQRVKVWLGKVFARLGALDL